MGFSEIRWCLVVQDRVGWDPVGSDGLRWDLMGFSGIRWCLVVQDKVGWDPVGSDGIRWDLMGFSGIRWCLVVQDGVGWDLETFWRLTLRVLLWITGREYQVHASHGDQNVPGGEEEG